MQRIERIIKGIEKVFDGYAQDERLKETLKESGLPLQLFPTYSGESYFLTEDGTIKYTYMDDRSLRISSSPEAAQTYLEYLHFNRIHPLTLTVCIKSRRAAGGCLAAAFPASMPGSFLACPRDRRGRSASSLLRLLPPPRVIGA